MFPGIPLGHFKNYVSPKTKTTYWLKDLFCFLLFTPWVSVTPLGRVFNYSVLWRSRTWYDSGQEDKNHQQLLVGDVMKFTVLNSWKVRTMRLVCRFRALISTVKESKTSHPWCEAKKKKKEGKAHVNFILLWIQYQTIWLMAHWKYWMAYGCHNMVPKHYFSIRHQFALPNWSSSPQLNSVH